MAKRLICISLNVVKVAKLYAVYTVYCIYREIIDFGKHRDSGRREGEVPSTECNTVHMKLDGIHVLDTKKNHANQSNFFP